MESGTAGIPSPSHPGGRRVIVASGNIPQLIEELKQKKFYGLLSLQFRDGEITCLERKETILTDKANIQGGTRVHRDSNR
jgi:hypothetical protein